MKKYSVLFLQAVTVLIGIGAVAFLLWEPTAEGRNVNATLFEIYFKDPFLVYAYIASIPFFIALVQAFKLLGYVGSDTVFSSSAMKAVRTIRYCAVAIIGFVVPGLFFIRFFSGSDDSAGGVAMGVFIIFGSLIVSAVSSTLERILRSAGER